MGWRGKENDLSRPSCGRDQGGAVLACCYFAERPRPQTWLEREAKSGHQKNSRGISN